MKLDTTKAREHNLRPLTLKQTLKSFSNFKEEPSRSRNANELNKFQRNIRYKRNINRKKYNRIVVGKGRRTTRGQFKTLYP